MKIVSLVPSYSKLLVDMGLRDSLIAVTKFCVDPADLYRTAMTVGGTKDPELKTILDLEPDVVLVNTEENRVEDIVFLKKHLNVHESCPETVEESLDLIEQLYEYFNIENSINFSEYRKKIDTIRERKEKLESILYFIWKKPYMLASQETYINSVLELAGYKNLAPVSSRYPVVEVSEIVSLDPDLIIFSDEPYPFRKRDVKALNEELKKTKQFKKACGKIFSWHGSHTIEMIDRLYKGEELLKDM